MSAPCDDGPAGSAVPGQAGQAVQAHHARPGHASAWAFHLATSYGSTDPVGTSGAPGAEETAAAPVPSDPVRLPRPELPADLRGLLERRASCRSFAEKPLSLSELGAVLFAGYGVLGEVSGVGLGFDHRPVPSAGARYPLRLFVLARTVTGLEPATYRYDPAVSQLVPVGPRPEDLALAELLIDQPYCATAPAVVVVAAEVRRTLARYGDRGYRYVLLEAGHVAQNVALCAAATGLGSLPVGGFQDARVSALLASPDGSLVPVYAAALGHPGSKDLVARRVLG